LTDHAPVLGVQRLQLAGDALVLALEPGHRGAGRRREAPVSTAAADLPADAAESPAPPRPAAREILVTPLRPRTARRGAGRARRCPSSPRPATRWRCRARADRAPRPRPRPTRERPPGPRHRAPRRPSRPRRARPRIVA